jgi:hypothetical protein
VNCFSATVLVRLRLDDVLPGARQGHFEIVDEGRPALDEVVLLHREDAMLGERDGLLEDGGVREMKHHPALDLLVPGDLE